LFLTDVDLCKRETGVGNTFSYKTNTGDYDDSVKSITDAVHSVVTFKAGTTIQTDGVAAGDYFILDDDHDSDSEADTAWAAILSVDSETQCTLSPNYATNGTTGDWTGSEKDGLIRKVFTAPTNPAHWSFCVADDKFIFCNVNEHVWYWSGSGYASALDSTNATTFKFCIEFADRLVLAYKDDQPTLIQWSKNGDPTDWTASTAGSAELLTSGNEITGLGKIGSYLVVYTKNSMIFGYRTGIPTSPISFMAEKPGIGCWSGPSIVNANGTNYFAGRNNFYMVEGMKATPIGDPIAREVFDNIAVGDIDDMVGVHNARQNEIMWRENTGGRIFVYNYKDRTWNLWQHGTSYTGTSMGLWTLSSDEEVMIHSNSKLGYFSEGEKNDFDGTITFYAVTPRLDFSDQDEEAASYNKTVYSVRVWYRDLTTTTTLNLLYKKNDDTNFATWDQEVVGDGDGTLKFIDMENIDTGYSFQFAVSEGATGKDVQIEKLEVFYELSSPAFNI
jgi:hypothetical protein